MAADNRSNGGKSATANKRGAARLAAVQALYQMEVGAVSMEDTLSNFPNHFIGKEVEGDQYLPADADYFGQIVKGVVKHQLEIDPILDKALAEEWPVGRIDTTMRAVLRAAAYELLKKRDIPSGIVINEYVDVAKAFFEDDAAGMVNAVLDSIAKQLPAQN